MDSDRQRIIERYNARFAQYGYDIRTLASGDPARHRLRHQILTDVGITPGATVLDVGCGFGDYRSYLIENGLDVIYAGYDINPTLLEVARDRHPGVEFAEKDILSDDYPVFDYVVSSNAFNLKLAEHDNYEFAGRVLASCLAHARCGVAIDFLTSYVDFKGADAFHYDPSRLFAMAKQLTKRVTLRHDYPLFEFCLYLYPDFQGWRADAI